MMNTDLFWPVFAQLGLMTALAFAMGVMRVNARLSGATKGLRLEAGQRNWPGRIQQVSSAFANQFETPVLLYAGVAFAWILQASDPLLAMLAWGYVATRFVHAAIYVSVNIIPIRFSVFAAGFGCLAAFWIVLAQHVAAG